MLYTGKGNKIIFWVLIPLFLIAYLAFRVSEWQHMSDENRALIPEQHSKNILHNANISCLILGGSNAVFSLSAERLSSELNLNCYNLSLLHEGHSDSAYWQFVEDMPLSNLAISHVFYSSVSPIATQRFFNERIKNEERGIGISGDLPFKLFGNSIAAYLKTLLLEGELVSIYPLPNSYGDFVFESYGGCNKVNIKRNFLPVQDLEALRSWGSIQLEHMKSLFPNAQLHLVLPSTLRSERFNEADFYEVVNVLMEIASETSNATQQISLIEQTPFTLSSVLCDARHHANAKGREIRTSELIQIFRNVN